MPKVTISSSKGLEQTSGSGFSVSDVELVRSNETVTPTSGASWEIVCKADSSSDLDGDYFHLYAQDGTSYGVWFEVDSSGTTVPAGATSGIDNQVAVEFAEGASAAVVAAAIVLAINTDATALYDFEAVDDGGGTFTVYVLFTGAMTTTTETGAPDAVTSVTLTDGSDAIEAIDEDIECSHLIVGNAVAVVELASLLADGSVVGQRKNLIFKGHATGEVNVGGSFSSAGSAASLLSMTAHSASHHGVAMLVWNGSAWTVVHNVNVTAS
jgi:hypothetical protein